MFNIKYYYNPIINRSDCDEELIAKVYMTNGKNIKFDSLYIDTNYHRLMNTVEEYSNEQNFLIDSSLFYKLKALIKFYFK